MIIIIFIMMMQTVTFCHHCVLAYQIMLFTGTGVSTFTGSPSPVIGDINKHSVRRVYAGANTSFAITGTVHVYIYILGKGYDIRFQYYSYS